MKPTKSTNHKGAHFDRVSTPPITIWSSEGAAKRHADKQAKSSNTPKLKK